MGFLLPDGEFLHHLVSVEERANGITCWTIRGPLGIKSSFDAEIISEQENEKLVWRSLPGSDIASSGSVTFVDAPQQFGTEIRVDLQYTPPAGRVGVLGASLLGSDARKIIEADCWRLKEYLETGEVATTEGQPSGRSAGVSGRRSRHSEGSTFQPKEVFE